jgi:L-seryl-tRNA(Ser) seleniumtransferase
MSREEGRPPSVDRLARSVTYVDLPHPLLVVAARQAIAAGDPDAVGDHARALARLLLQPVVNATGVLLHTNLGRAPLAVAVEASATNLELSLADGSRGSRQDAVGVLAATLCGAEAALVVNNGAAAVTLATAALASGRQVAVSRGESVEIGGGFRIPEVVAASGARLVDVGTTNRTRVDDFRAAVEAPDGDVACILRVHPSNFRVEGFTDRPPVTAGADLGVPVVVDLGSGLVDARCPWLAGPPPAWLAGEPAARQVLDDGASLVTFSGDKLLGGPQAGLVVGRADLVARCARHPLARALRPGGLVLAALQEVLLAYLRGDAAELPFWRQATAPVDALRRRADAIAAALAGAVEVRASEAAPGAGTVPGATIPSVAVVVPGDRREHLRSAPVPVVARVADDATWCDLRTVEPAQDEALTAALRG